MARKKKRNEAEEVQWELRKRGVRPARTLHGMVIVTWIFFSLFFRMLWYNASTYCLWFWLILF